jgi:chaperonin cofactor prefoldin
MQPRISPAVKSAVIEAWLKGMGRDAIADTEGIGGGTATNIIREWRGGLDGAVADELREFAVGLRKLKISAPRCALGARVASMMSSLGMHENDFQTFMSETYDHCLEVGLKPERVAYYLKQVLDLCDSMPLEQIPDHIEQQIARKQQLEEEIQTLQARELESRKRVDIAMKEVDVSLKDLNEFSEFKTEVNKQLGIRVVNFSAFVNTIKGVQQLGFDPKSIMAKVSYFEELEWGEQKLKVSIDSLAKSKNNLEKDCTGLQSEIDVRSLTISKYKELEDMGFGYKVQKLLWHRVREIGVANQMDPDEAVGKFLKDVEEQYDDKLGFESKLNNLKAEVQKNEPMTQFSMMFIIIYIVSILSAHLEDIQRLGEFRPLLRAGKGQDVPINELKFAVSRAIEIMVRRLPPIDRIVPVLNSAKVVLEETQNDII